MDGLIDPVDFQSSGAGLSWSTLNRANIGVGKADRTNFDPEAQDAIDMLRTRIAMTMRENNWKRLAIASPTAGCGATTLACGLALSLSRQRDTSVVLFDLNLRAPGVAGWMGLEGDFDVTDLFNGKGYLPDHLVRFGDKLAIAPNSHKASDPTETLHAASTAGAIRALQSDLAPSYLVFDLPPMLEFDDLLGLLPALDCVLLVIGAERSSFGEADACERELAARNKLLGVVLNKCRLGLNEFDI